MQPGNSSRGYVDAAGQLNSMLGSRKRCVRYDIAVLSAASSLASGLDLGRQVVGRNGDPRIAWVYIVSGGGHVRSARVGPVRLTAGFLRDYNYGRWLNVPATLLCTLPRYALTSMP